MADSHRSNGSSSGSSARECKLEDLVALYLGRLNDGESLDRDQILADHPNLGEEILKSLEAFIDMTGQAGSDLPLGTLGDYTLRRQIGRGGMGVVYEAWQNSMDRQVALKVMPKAVAVDTRAVARFIQEAQLAGKLNHPNIVHVHGMGVEQQIPYYAMDFVEGETLGQIVGRLKDLEPEAETPFGHKDGAGYFESIARAFADVADGLQHAHSKGIIHRDIKPSNLILDRDGRLRILDFGLARLEGQESLTISGDVVGTPQYMSPEQARRKKIEVDHRTDVYSLGATLYEMLTLKPPFRGKDHQDTLSQIIERDPVEPRRVNPRVPKDLETIVLKCLRKEAVDRYGTAEALGQDLRRFVRGEVIEARAQARWEKVTRKFLAQRWRILTGVCLGLFLVASGGILRNQVIEARRKEEDLYRGQVLGALMKLETAQMILQAEGEGASKFDPWRRFTRWGSKAGAAGRGLAPLEAAMADLQRAAAGFPGKPDAYYQRARGFLLLGQEEEAGKALDEALATETNFVPARVLKAALLEKRSDEEGARREMERIRKGVNRRWVESWLGASIGEIHREWKQAAEAYSRLIVLEASGPEPFVGAFLEARLGRGKANLELKGYFQALEDFVAATALWPDLVEPALLKGKTYYLLGKPDLAKVVFEDTYNRAAFPQEVARVLMVLHGAMFGDREEALHWAERLGEGAGGLAVRAGCLNVLHRHEEAEKCARKALDLDDRNAEAWSNLAGALLYRGRWAEEVEAIERAITLEPDDPAYYNCLGYGLYSLGKTEDALSAFETSTRKDPSFFGGRLGLWECLFDLGRIDEGMAELEKAHRAAPDSPLVLNSWGCMLATRGQYEEAKEAFDRAAVLDPDYDACFINAGLARGGQGKLDEAIEKLRKAVNVRAGRHFWPGYHAGLAWILGRKGDLEEAAWEWCEAVKLDSQVWDPCPYGWDALDHLVGALARRPPSERLQESLDDLSGALEKCCGRSPEDPEGLKGLALVLLHGRKARDLERALRCAGKAVQLGSPGDSAPVSVLASALFASGKPEEAILTLEEALEFPEAKRFLTDQVEEYREAVSPALVSYASIDAALAAAAVEIRGKARDPMNAQYLEARILECGGKFLEAADKFKQLLAAEGRSREPVLRLAECLRAAGDPVAAEAELRASIERGHGTREIWDAWAVVSLLDLSSAPEAMLASFPDDPTRGYGEDLRWLLGRLTEGGGIRIDCGGEEDRTSKGAPWGRDRFFHGGRAVRRGGAVKGSSDAVLYATEHWFAEEQAHPAYHIPLPSGAYQVILHFAELAPRAPVTRAFDVRIEGAAVLEDYAPARVGLAVADVRTFQAEVVDGMLDVEFVQRVESPCISAIEIERVE